MTLLQRIQSKIFTLIAVPKTKKEPLVGPTTKATN
jgi:hypothetical protein